MIILSYMSTTENDVSVLDVTIRIPLYVDDDYIHGATVGFAHHAMVLIAVHGM